MAKSRKERNGETTPGSGDIAPDSQDLALESGAPQSVGDTTAATPDRDRIAMRAYELYLARGGSDGEALEDWLNAERELTEADNPQSGGSSD